MPSEDKTKKPENKLEDSGVPTCAYCGAILKDRESQCPSCGARVRRIK